MKILFASFDVVPAPKGASTHILQSTSALADAFGSVLLVCAGAPGQEPEEVLYPGVTARRAPAVSERNFLKRVTAYQDFLRTVVEETGDIQVAHFRDVWSGLVLLDRQDEFLHMNEPAPFRLVYEINGLASFELPYHYPALTSGKGFIRKLRAQEVACMVAADRIVTVCETGRRHVLRCGLAPAKVAVIPNGFDPRRFQPSSPAAEAADNEPPLLLYLGTLAPWQGIHTLLRAIKKVSREVPVRCVFAGRGRKEWLKESLSLASELKILDFVDFRGAVDPKDVPGLIRSARLCLAPLEHTRRNTRQGCSPIKIIEYMACARPFVASDIPVVRELLPRDGGMDFSPFLVTAGKPGALAERILYLLHHRNESEALARRLSAHAFSNLTWDKANGRLVALYESMPGVSRTSSGPDGDASSRQDA